MIVITLPWPDKALKPNKSRPGNWWEKSKAARSYKSVCFSICEFDKPVFPASGNIPLSIMFYPKRNAGDLDNMLSQIKNGIDGMAEAWGINDKRFRPITIDMAKADKTHPRVEITWLTE